MPIQWVNVLNCESNSQAGARLGTFYQENCRFHSKHRQTPLTRLAAGPGGPERHPARRRQGAGRAGAGAVGGGQPGQGRGGAAAAGRGGRPQHRGEDQSQHGTWSRDPHTHL